MHEPISRNSSSISSSSSINLYVPIRIRLFAAQFRLIREMMYKPDKDGRTLRHLSGVEWAKVKRGQNNAWQTQRASTAIDPKKKKKATKINEKEKKIPVKLPDIIRAESSAKIPLPKELRKVDYQFILRGNDKLHQENYLRLGENLAHQSALALHPESDRSDAIPTQILDPTSRHGRSIRNELQSTIV